MKKLILAEKPSVGKDIARALGANTSKQGYLEGNGYIVTWAMGHLVTLKDPEGYHEKFKNWDMEHLPILPDKMQLTLIPQGARQFKLIKSLLANASEVIIATDAGREGELVARWILDYAKCKLPIKRLWISSVTNKAILDGFKNLKDGRDYVNLYHSAVSRATADWLVGINGTRALTTKFNASLSCGRVQTPTLSIINQRENDIRQFVPKDYSSLSFTAEGVKFHHGERIFDKTKAGELLTYLKGQPITVSEVKASLKKSHTTGYDLTSLQQDANRLFGFSATQTLDLCQKLYERHKVLTYPRTDAKYITSDIVDTLKDRLQAVNFGPYAPFASKLLREGVQTKNLAFVNDAKVSDHHALIPTEEPADFSDLSNHERKIYDLVVKKFLAMLSPAYQFESTTVTLAVGNKTFTTKGKRVIEKGYKAVYDKSDIEETEDEGNDQPAPLPKRSNPYWHI